MRIIIALYGRNTPKRLILTDRVRDLSAQRDSRENLASWMCHKAEVAYRIRLYRPTKLYILLEYRIAIRRYFVGGLNWDRYVCDLVDFKRNVVEMLKEPPECKL